MGLSPSLNLTNACRHGCKYTDQKGSDAMLTSIQTAGVAPEVNLRITGFETHGRCRSLKRGVSVAHKKGPVSSKFFFKEIKILPFVGWIYHLNVSRKLKFSALNYTHYLSKTTSTTSCTYNENTFRS